MHYALCTTQTFEDSYRLGEVDDIDEEGDGDDDGRRSPLKPGKDDSQGDSRAGPDRRTRRPLHMLNLVVGSIYTSSFGKSLSSRWRTK